MQDYCRIYVAQLKSWNLSTAYFYVGKTGRMPEARYEEHEAGVDGKGSMWCKKHGFKGYLICMRVPPHMGSTLENDLTAWLVANVGWHRVRGGDYMVTSPDRKDMWWLPPKLRTGSFRDVLELRTGSVTKFRPQLRGLIDALLASSRPQHPHQLDTNSFAYSLLR